MHKLISAAAAALFISACGGDVTDPHDHNEQEVITIVRLTFTAGVDRTVATFDDPDGDGGAAPTIDGIALTASSTYAVTVQLENGLESPAEDITAEVREEADEHQLFFTGDAVSGPATSNTDAILTHSYADMDDDGLPIGLDNTIVAERAGTGSLTLTLRHLPSEDGVLKVADLASTAASGGITALPGDSDVSVTFDVTVQ
ncbi:MAG: type 1 periplasmic binding fold superfamily protein [Deltaproteobacteria bacterium]